MENFLTFNVIAKENEKLLQHIQTKGEEPLDLWVRNHPKERYIEE